LELRLTINDLSFSYGSSPVLKGVDLAVELGEVLGIVGPNGSGKSTLLKCINRILKTKHNTVFVDGKDINKLNLKELSKIMGYVPQSSVSVFPFTVFDIVMMGRTPYIHWSPSEQDYKIIAETLDFLGLNELAMRHFNELSGGEQQKVMIARALAQQPKILLLDEPTSNLDIKHQLEILYILKNLAQSKYCSIVMAIHDLNIASRFSDKMLMLKKGCIFAAGTPENVLTEENIEAVYGIKAQVTKSIMGKPQVIPLEPLSSNEASETSSRSYLLNIKSR
jgi:iron complex transport system ATP-binding protein